jgi:hypothetical protein
MQISGPELFSVGQFAISPVQPAPAVSDALMNLQHSAHIIASDPNTAPSILEGLARVCNPTVLEHIATNANTPPAILETLVAHPEPNVRAALAENKSTPFSCLWRLAHDEDADVRFQLAENHNLPKQVLSALAEDDNPYVACRAQKTLERISSEPALETSQDWKAFRRAQLNKRIAHIRDLEEGTPMAMLGKMFSNLTRYARAI